MRPGDLVAPVFSAANVYSFTDEYGDDDGVRVAEVKKGHVALVVKIGEGDSVHVLTGGGLHGWMIASLVKVVQTDSSPV